MKVFDHLLTVRASNLNVQKMAENQFFDSGHHSFDLTPKVCDFFSEAGHNVHLLSKFQVTDVPIV